jgi:hypothetical protein
MVRVFFFFNNDLKLVLLLANYYMQIISLCWQWQTVALVLPKNGYRHRLMVVAKASTAQLTEACQHIFCGRRLA